MEARILVVDDEESIRYSFEEFLLSAGHSVTTACGVYDALAKGVETGFDLIVSDVILDDGTGIDILRKVSRGKSTCPVVMITGCQDSDTWSEAMRLGAFDCLAKPVTQKMLIEVTDRALRHWNREQGASRSSSSLGNPAAICSQNSRDRALIVKNGDRERDNASGSIRRILVVDDESSICEALALGLTTHEVAVDVAENGETAIRLGGMRQYDVLVVDWNLPDVDGIEVIRRIKAQHPKIIAILITAWATRKNREQAAAVGAVDFLEKPFPLKAIKAAVARVLADRNQQQGLVRQ